MPQYTFEFENSETECVTADFPSDGAAIQAARLRALNGSAHHLSQHKRAQRIVVKADGGRVVDTVKMR